MTNLCLIIGMLIVLLWPCAEGGAFAARHTESVHDPMNYADAMTGLVHEIHSYACRVHPGFMIATNGGADLFYANAYNSDENVSLLLKSVEGVVVESVFFGWDMTDNKETPRDESEYFKEILSVPQREHIPVLNIDYCSDRKIMKKAYAYNNANGYIGYAAPRRELDKIPHGIIIHENSVNCDSLQKIRNFLPLLNSQQYSSKEGYLQALRDTNYDLLILDLFCGDGMLTEDDVASLKYKKNGARRLVFAYMSVGEAEDYRYYWKSEWDRTCPPWIDEVNEDWSGNYKVKYWRKEWKDILYGHRDSYLDLILDSDFDGAFLDVIDAYEYFRQKA